MLAGDFMQLVREDGKWRLPRSSIKRYWQTELWTRFFDTLLCWPGGGHAADLGQLADEMQMYLDDDRQRRQNLKQALQSQLSVLREMRMLPR